MDIPDLTARLAVLGVTFCLSAFFSGSETALFSLPPDELQRMAHGSGADRAAAELRRQPKRLLIIVLFGNMVVNTIFYSVSFLIILDLGPRVRAAGVFLLSLASLLAVIIGGEVVPKNLAVTFYRPLARAAAWPLLLLQRGLMPLLFPLERLAEAVAGLWAVPKRWAEADELCTLVSLGSREGAVDARSAQMVGRVIGLSHMRVKHLMVHRVDVAKFNLQEAPERLLELLTRHKLSQVAAYDGITDEMRGLIHLKDALFRPPDQPLTALVRPIPFIPETTTFEDALRCCRRQGSKSAFVVDEYGMVVGLVTVEDLSEEIVGEIADEHEPEGLPELEILDDGLYRVQGGLSLRSWQELTSIELPDLGVDTVAGFMMARLDKVPEVGDAVRHGNVEFTVQSVQGRRAATILVRVLAPEGRRQEGGGA